MIDTYAQNTLHRVTTSPHCIFQACSRVPHHRCHQWWNIRVYHRFWYDVGGIQLEIEFPLVPCTEPRNRATRWWSQPAIEVRQISMAQCKTAVTLAMELQQYRAPHMPLLDSPGQVKPPVRQVYLSKVFLYILYKQTKKMDNSRSQACTKFWICRALQYCTKPLILYYYDVSFVSIWEKSYSVWVFFLFHVDTM